MEQPTTSARVALKFGLIAGVILMIQNVLINVTEQYMNTWLSSPIQIIVLSVCMVLAMREFKAGNDGFMNYGQGLGIGTLMGAVSGVLFSIYYYVYNEFIDPALKINIMSKVREQFENQGMSDEQIDTALTMTQKFSSPGFGFIFGVLGMILFAFIISLIVSAFQKNEKPTFD